MVQEVTVTLRRNILALSKAANSVVGELSSMTLIARDKEAETWDKIREIVREL
jgi:hypothetical protein